MGRRRLPPLKASDIIAMLKKDGWYEIEGGNHRNFKHPSKRGKAQVSDKWTGVKPGDKVWHGLKGQTGWSTKDMRELYFSL